MVPEYRSFIGSSMKTRMKCQHPQGDVATTKCRAPNYKMYRTQYTRSSEGRTSLYTRHNRHCSAKLLLFFSLRSTWRVLVFRFSRHRAIAMNWTFSEMIMPPFLERRFGESIPIYTIQSINLFGCLIFPPIVGAIYKWKRRLLRYHAR